jgi:hypothetical protein
MLAEGVFPHLKFRSFDDECGHLDKRRKRFIEFVLTMAGRLIADRGAITPLGNSAQKIQKVRAALEDSLGEEITGYELGTIIMEDECAGGTIAHRRKMPAATHSPGRHLIA